MKLTGAQIVIECLKEQGVDTIFGYPGAATINIYDELYKNSDKIRHVLTSHEQGAAHAADGYSRSSNRVGVCIATSGPGATNLVTGIATAYMDSIPLVAITGNVEMHKLGKDSFQEVDILGITMPITKHNFMVKSVDELAQTIRDAFTIAQTGRKGPVLIDIPKNITSEIAEYEYQEPKKVQPIQPETIDEQIFEMINKAKKPLILAGGGVVLSKASEELVKLAEKIQAPVSTTLMGTGCIAKEHPLNIGMVGMHGTMTSNISINKCDLLICVGARFSDRVVGNEKFFSKQAKIIHLDVDPAEINKNILVDAYAIGDVKLLLSEISDKIEQKENHKWLEEIRELNERYAYKYDTEVLNVPLIIKRLGERVTQDAIITTDVGQHQMWTAQHFAFKKPYQFLTSGGLGTMGYGLGASIGAQFANPDKRVIMVTGDGSFKMNFNEIVTAVRHRLPIKILIMDNNCLGMVRQWQDLFYDQRFAATSLNDPIDYVQFASSLGAKGYQINTIEEIDNVFEDALNNDNVCIIHCKVPSRQFVFPMVPPGKAIYEAVNEIND